MNLGYIYERQGKLELAEQEYRRAIKKDKKNWLAYYNLGNVYLRKGKWEEAEEHYRKALEIRRDPDTMNNLAYLLNRKGEHCEALELIREALRKAHRKEYIETREEIEKALKEKDVKCLNFEGELW
ncbi:MAG: tetratricopeptide repeat protein [Aquificaceae bacterium]|nr:tetratricopeptide repeat protein [Aquificaceae bacterium]